MFALVDCNNFFASCERVFRPDLNGKPVAVLSNNDGCVIARSNEVKALGIPMGAPAFKYKKEFEKYNIHVFSSNYALYGDMSARIMNMLMGYAPDIEIYSIDEAFLSFHGCDYLNFNEYGLRICKSVFKSTGVPVSMGVGPTKSLSKIAAHIAKKFPERTKGVYVIDTDEKRVKALKWLKIGDVWGVGRRYAKKLQYFGINTAYDLTQMPDAWVRKQMSVSGLRVKRELLGEECISLDHSQVRKSIATTRTFEQKYTKKDDVKERVSTFAASCAEKLRKQSSHCKSILVFIHTNAHSISMPQYAKSIVVQLPYATNSTIDIVHYARKAFDAIFKQGFEYKKAGVVALDICSEKNHQLSMFNQANPKHKGLMEAVDYLNADIGSHKVRFGTQSMGRTWKMKQERLSPSYTTKLSDAIIVNALEG